MSDPVSNSEIEDVLASIRRLVSENAKALKGDRTREPEADKLVLTPAHRIDESEGQGAPSDVFAVDTDTWNDVSREAEAAENKGIFAHREQRPPASVEVVEDAISSPLDAAASKAEAAVSEPAGDDASDDGISGLSAHDAAAEASARAAEAAVSGAAEPVSGESEPAADALEQRIAELETAMDLRPTDAEAAAEPVAEAGAVAEETAPDTGSAPEAAQPETEEKAAEPPASSAPPKSWIEGLVAAAAAAEAVRLSERAKQREAATDAPAALEVAEEPAAATETDHSAVGDEGVQEQAEATEAETAPLELTEAHAVSDTPDATAAAVDAEDSAEDSSAANTEDSSADNTEDSADEVSTEAEMVDAGVAETEPHAETDVAETAAEMAEGAKPERSWVDRLIAAAATLRTEPAGADTDKAEDEVEDEAASEEADVDLAAAADEEVDVAETSEETPGADAEESAEPAPPLTLEPLNLVDPIMAEPETEIEAAVPEWEPVDPPELAETADEAVQDATEGAEDGGDGDVDIETVLTGPWSAAAVAKEAAEETTPDESASPEDVPVGALEWEPVPAPDDTGAEPEVADEPEDSLADEIAVAEADVEDMPQDTDGHEETEAETADEEHASSEAEAAEDEVAVFSDETDAEETADTPDTGEIDAIDADAAAVAAAAEAEADWEEAGMAAAGVATVTSLYDRADADADSAEDGAENVPAARADDAPAVMEETVIDEAMLREIVAQIVRDELQGTVGERITHNVRRLIRREIARALTLQEFEK